MERPDLATLAPTQQKLADKVGIHLSYIGNIEIGAKRPSLETLFRIADELGVKVSDFFRFQRAVTPADAFLNT